MSTRDDFSEVSQIGNADVGVNIDVESHPVGSFTPQNNQSKGRNVLFSLSVMFAFFLFATLAKKIEKVRAEFGSKDWAPQGEIPRLRFQFAKLCCCFLLHVALVED